MNVEYTRTRSELQDLRHQVSVQLRHGHHTTAPLRLDEKGGGADLLLIFPLVPALQRQEPCSALYTSAGSGSSLSGLSLAQQLQVLHTENLQLKACLKQEVEARQQLDKKHTALMEMLR